VYDDNHEFAEGFLARSHYSECHICHLYHDGPCPTTNEVAFVKWRNSKHFDSGKYLYNYWFARSHVQDTKKLVLVESCGNVWKLVENDLPYCMGLFGRKLTLNQELIISRLGVHYIYLLLDNDEAGKSATKTLHDRLHRRFNIKTVEFTNYNDVGEMPNSFIKDRIVSQIEHA